MVRNLPTDMGVQTLQKELNKIMTKVFTPTLNGVECESYFVKSRVVGNYN
jgi:hypothetical protein